MLDLGADVSLACHDYFRFVRDGAFLRDLGAPFIAVDHGTLEEWGIRNLFDLLRERFPSIPVHFMLQGCCYRPVGCRPLRWSTASAAKGAVKERVVPPRAFSPGTVVPVTGSNQWTDSVPVTPDRSTVTGPPSGR